MKGGTDGKGDGPSLAIGKIGNVTMGDGNEKATIKVTITSKDDADKTAEVTLTVMCGEEVVAVADKGEMKAVGGVATYKDVDLGKHEKAVDCTADASATLGGKEVKATQVKFKIVEADKPPAPTITLVSPVIEDTTSALSLNISFEHENLATDAAFMVHIGCGSTAPVDVAAVKVADAAGKSCADEDAGADGVQCTLVSGGSATQMCGVVVVSGKTESNLGTVTLK